MIVAASTNLETRMNGNNRRLSRIERLRTLPPLDINRRYPIELACDYLDIGRTRIYAKIEAGELPIIRDGGRVFIPGEAIAAASRAP